MVNVLKLPVKESLASEHSGELLGDALEQLLDGGAVADKGGGHLEAAGWDIADSGLHVVGDPFNKVTAVFVLNVEHLLVDLLHGHTSTEYGGDSEVAAVAGVAGSHHVLGVEHLLGELRDGESSVLLGATGGQRGEAGHEEVETGEWNHINSQFAEIGVQLTRETQTSSDTGHGCGDEVVQVTVCGRGEFQGSEADIVESLIVDAVALIGVLDQLVDGEGGVVGLHDGVRYLKHEQDQCGLFCWDKNYHQY